MEVGVIGGGPSLKARLGSHSGCRSRTGFGPGMGADWLSSAGPGQGWSASLRPSEVLTRGSTRRVLQTVEWKAPRRCRETGPVRVRADERTVEFDLEGEVIADDYYSVLGLTHDATPDEIKRAYYSCMKACHPDLSGDHEDNVAFCQFVNEIYEVLSDGDMRAVYDEIQGYNISGTNPFMDTWTPRDHAFVDEFSCIGCKNCANTAERTFDIEMDFGRARVARQNGDPRGLVQEAIDTCPVNCIHWVSAAQLTLLEDEMRRMERVNVGMMGAGMGRKGGTDVFGQAQWRWEKRQRQAVDRQRVRMAQGTGFNNWADYWKPAGDDIPEEKETQSASSSVSGRRREKMAQAAAAARKWRDFSRRGVDRKATRYLNASESIQADDVETLAR